MRQQFHFELLYRHQNIKFKSPGPAVYPSKEKETGDKNRIPTIYPSETKLAPTMKGRYNIVDKRKTPAANAYPVVEGKQNSKKFTIDFMRKMATGRKSPAYSLGVRHTPKQQYLVLPEDEY